MDNPKIKALPAGIQSLINRIKAQNDSMNAVISAIQPAKTIVYTDRDIAESLSSTPAELARELDIIKNEQENKYDTRENFEAYSEALENTAVVLADSMGPPKMSKPVSFMDKIRARAQAKAAKQADDELAAEADPEEHYEAEPEDIVPVHVSEVSEVSKAIQTFDPKGESFSLNIVLNERQQSAAILADSGKSFVLTGPAGTGKTTTQRAVGSALLRSNRLSTSRFKYYDANGERQYGTSPSIAFCAYTRRAASNLRKAIHKLPELEEAFKYNITTIHALLEYEPEMYWDAIEMKEKFRFAPKRTAANPLTITHLVIEESSMLGLDLWEKLYDALPYGVQIIFIGDINQLPPVFGPSILNYALIQLPIVELTEVYRNQGIVLENAHHILKGETLSEDKDYIIVRGKEKVQQPQRKVARGATALLNQLMDVIGDDGFPEYDPDDCAVLTPFNVQDCGSEYINNCLAQLIGDRRKAIVYEVLGGMNKRYLAVGDKVMFNKRDGVITDIYPNPGYSGKIPQLPGSDLSRFGVRVAGEADLAELNATILHDNEKLLSIDYSSFDLEDESATKKQQASHCVVITYEDETSDTIQSAGDFASAVFSLGYALTVHKAQGSEWRKVFIIIHKDHYVMHYRELLYTAATRARTKVTIIGKDATINKIIANPRIKGNTLKDKLEFFNSGIDQTATVYCTKI